MNAEPESGKKRLEVGGNVQGIFDLGPGRFGSEAVFVPHEPGITSEEDDGYLIFFVHDEANGYVFLTHIIIEDYSFLFLYLFELMLSTIRLKVEIKKKK